MLACVDGMEDWKDTWEDVSSSKNVVSSCFGDLFKEFDMRADIEPDIRLSDCILFECHLS